MGVHLQPLELGVGFIPFFQQKIQRYFKDFQGHISHFPFSRTPFSAKKSLEYMSFLVLPQHEQVSVLCLLLVGTGESWLDKVSAEIPGLSSTDCNFKDFQGLVFFILKFKDFQ